MTRYEKITISLPSRAAESARRAVREGRAASVSAYVVAAMESQATATSWDELVAEIFEETGGPAQPWEDRAVMRALRLRPDGTPDPGAPRVIHLRQVFEEERKRAGAPKLRPTSRARRKRK